MKRLTEIRICEVDGCSTQVKTRNLCSKHYQRLRLHGDVHHDGRPDIKHRAKARLCSVEGCGMAHESAGYCRLHRYRVANIGGLELPTAEQRFWAKVDKTETCWLWTAGLSGGTGYGSFLGTDQKHTSAHRFSYELHNGPIPDGYGAPDTCKRGHDWATSPPYVSKRPNGKVSRRCSVCDLEAQRRRPPRRRRAA